MITTRMQEARAYIECPCSCRKVQCSLTIGISKIDWECDLYECFDDSQLCFPYCSCHMQGSIPSTVLVEDDVIRIDTNVLSTYKR